MLTHSSSLTQDLWHNFRSTVSRWITPLFLTPHLRFYYFLGSWLFYSLSIISLFWGIQMFEQFQTQVVLGLSSQSRVLFFPRGAVGSLCKDITDGSQVPTVWVAALHLPPCLHGSRAAQTGLSFKWGLMAHCRRLHQSFVSLWWNLCPSGWDA